MDATEFEAKIKTLQPSDFMAETIAPLDDLKESATSHMKYKMELFVTHLQAKVLGQLQAYEPTKQFQVDRWQRELGGGGITCILQDGRYLFSSYIYMNGWSHPALARKATPTLPVSK